MGYAVVKIIRFFKLIRKQHQFVRHDSVQNDVGTCNGERGSGHAEFELVAGEGHGGGAVPVRVVLGNRRHHVDADIQSPLAGALKGSVINDGIHDSAQLSPKENRDNSRRRFLRAETVVVAGGCHGGPQHILILINALDKGCQKQEELRVLPGS